MAGESIFVEHVLVLDVGVGVGRAELGGGLVGGGRGEDVLLVRIVLLVGVIDVREGYRLLINRQSSHLRLLLILKIIGLASLQPHIRLQLRYMPVGNRLITPVHPIRHRHLTLIILYRVLVALSHFLVVLLRLDEF